eukprot:CAMPEP_0181180098 /NCGR_PEP_ID=MMETSP1096-20121128/6614_1 /TAXON_ID=156174 ORGANISM="Chrysochromulina ericina, Strain CCMP281" /NCGR_SAMPLE_ID=MMETSP1096 /ASSEMBLY_ACC=CAM_ASM_000453 /LENGTH=128 /DNA_ID=CAMNT_0023268495 /DNA_START=266 /DNA_END=649 /DNA_ORIENTATION=-
MISELKEQDFLRKEVLGHAEYLGQDAVGPDGKATVDLARGLTNPWDVARVMRDLLGCTTTHRELSYWTPLNPAVLRRLLDLTRRGAFARGEMICLCCVSDAMLVRAVMKGGKHVEAALVPGQPEHWVR